MPSLKDRFIGSLLGLALGDALGGCFEAQSGEYIQNRFPSVDSLIHHPPKEELYYTDDTQMTIALAESLIAKQQIEETHLCQSFVANYHPSRGYGRGARAILEAMEDQLDYQSVAENYFPGGSYGNGAAMRVAPIGLFFHQNPKKVWEQARLSAYPTHKHPLGIEGAQILALAISMVLNLEKIDPSSFYATLLERVENSAFQEKLKLASGLKSSQELIQCGNGIEALNSVPTAIAAFVLHPNSYTETIAQSIFLGGDTDTIAAMAGAISGAFLGVEALPEPLLSRLEKTPKGKSYLLQLGERLFEQAKALNFA